MVRVRPGSLIYRQIKSLHCSGYLLVKKYSGLEIQRRKLGGGQAVNGGAVLEGTTTVIREKP